MKGRRLENVKKVRGCVVVFGGIKAIAGAYNLDMYIKDISFIFLFFEKNKCKFGSKKR